jgi:hypothetical protein
MLDRLLFLSVFVRYFLKALGWRESLLPAIENGFLLVAKEDYSS